MTKTDQDRAPELDSSGQGGRGGIDGVRDVIRALLAEDGCPWDRRQTPQSLSDYIIEEGFELVEALRGDSPLDQGPQASPKPTAEAMEELGDVFFLLLMVAEFYERAGRFTLEQCLEANAAKMIRRHPHVFDGLELKSREHLLKNWERIKRGEKSGDGPRGVYDSLPKGLPPLLKAYRIHSKAARNGFTWETDQDAYAQLSREWDEWVAARDSGDPARMEDEFGDYLFTLAEIGRRHGIKANAALDFANLKFLRRFEAMEALARERGLDLPSLDLDAMNALWDEIKAGQ